MLQTSTKLTSRSITAELAISKRFAQSGLAFKKRLSGSLSLSKRSCSARSRPALAASSLTMGRLTPIRYCVPYQAASPSTATTIRTPHGGSTLVPAGSIKTPFAPGFSSAQREDAHAKATRPTSSQGRIFQNVLINDFSRSAYGATLGHASLPQDSHEPSA